ncbi:hypothetical protein CDAR_287731 [Caerostris darwini]|uniref:Uncharacterized protein n=1 Tax=Caerostris darwini TaxID=1538125 RepID=A0AAV4NGX9_9ARAC|nr:hypothetical protein CDAR_287731 [Caerostris darwini]
MVISPMYMVIVFKIKILILKDETDKGAMGFKSTVGCFRLKSSTPSLTSLQSSLCLSIKQKSHRSLRLPPTRFLLASYKQVLAPRKPFGV